MLNWFFLFISIIYAGYGFAADSDNPSAETKSLTLPAEFNRVSSGLDFSHFAKNNPNDPAVKDMNPTLVMGEEYPESNFDAQDRKTKPYGDREIQLILREQELQEEKTQIPIYYSPAEFYAATGTILPKVPKMFAGSPKQVFVYFSVQTDEGIEGLENDASTALKVWAKFFKVDGLLFSKTDNLLKADLVIQVVDKVIQEDSLKENQAPHSEVNFIQVKMPDTIKAQGDSSEEKIVKNRKREIPVIRLFKDNKTSDWTSIHSIKKNKLKFFSIGLKSKYFKAFQRNSKTEEAFFGDSILSERIADFIVKNKPKIQDDGNFVQFGKSKRLVYSHIIKGLANAFGYPELVTDTKKLYPEFDFKCEKPLLR